MKVRRREKVKEREAESEKERVRERGGASGGGGGGAYTICKYAPDGQNALKQGKQPQTTSTRSDTPQVY